MGLALVLPKFAKCWVIVTRHEVQKDGVIQGSTPGYLHY